LRRLLVRANVVPSSPILLTLMMETLSSSETSVFTRATKHNILEDAFPHTANVVHSSLILFTLMMEALSFSETSVHTRDTRRHIPEEGILLTQCLLENGGKAQGTCVKMADRRTSQTSTPFGVV
jgi:hypothetical protein